MNKRQRKKRLRKYRVTPQKVVEIVALIYSRRLQPVRAGNWGYSDQYRAPSITEA